MKTKLVCQLAGCFFLSACSTITFTNGPVDVKATPSMESNWHHNMWLSLYEASSPVDLKQRCVGNNWVRITTERSFTNGLVGGLDGQLLRVGAVGIDIWDPWTVAYECK